MQACPQNLCMSIWVRKVDLIETIRIIIRVQFYMESSLGQAKYFFTNILWDVNQNITRIRKLFYSLENKIKISTSIGGLQTKLFLCGTNARYYVGEKCVKYGALMNVHAKLSTIA